MQLSELLSQFFPYTPTPEQELLFRKLEQFVSTPAKGKPVFILKGYAGTGKTLVLQTLARSLRKLRRKTLLLAPTGRAAKVLSKSAGQEAYTVHRQLYKPVQHPYSGKMEMEARKNYHTHTLFVVDEASMLSSEGTGDKPGLLLDLIEFIYSQPGNTLLLVGDPAQLPPVGEPSSIALEPDVLQYAYGLQVTEHTLTQVSRQQAGSGILSNATYLRDCLNEIPQQLHLNTTGYADVFQLPETRLLEGLRYSFNKNGPDNTLVICATNEETQRFNSLIRTDILGYQEKLVKGDLLMIARNNYLHSARGNKLNFLANGEFIEVVNVLGEEERWGFHFLRLQLRLPDNPTEAAFESLVLTETLSSPQPALTDARNRSLFEAVSRNYRFLARSKQVKALRKDPYLNALQVKYAYALTCHKAQGGQWHSVFLQANFWMQENNTADKLRWLYTAVTRASKELFIIKPSLQYS